MHAVNYTIDFVNRIYSHDDYRGAFAWALRACLEQCTTKNIYVASFTANPDLLSQWRGYCPNGAGFCLGFSCQNLAGFSAENEFRLAECIYDEDILHKNVVGLLCHCEQIFPKPPVSREVYDRMNPQEQASVDQAYSIVVNE